MAFIYSKSVDFHETDLAGLVHFTHYLRWMELAEHAFLKSIGVPPLEHTGNTLHGWPRRKAQCEYLAPLTYADMVEIEVRLVQLDHKQLNYTFLFFKCQNKMRTLVANGQLTTCFIVGELHSGNKRAVLIPDAYLDKCRATLDTTDG